MDDRALLDVALEIGYQLLKNGGEIYRVEDSIKRVLIAYGAEGVEVFAIPSCVIVTLKMQGSEPLTRIKRIRSAGTDLDRVERYNDLCRSVCATCPPEAEVRAALKKADEAQPYGLWIQVAAYALIAFSFTLFYGGNLADALCAILCGAAVKLVVHKMNQLHTNTFFLNIVASALAAVIAMACARLGLMQHSDKVIIGTFMTLVPGVAITNVMRDIIAGDLIAGISRLTESLLVATAIALGAGIAISAARLMLGGI